MTITRKSLADVIDEIDDQIADLQASKRDTFQSYREQLSAVMGKDEVKVEIEATKAAIKRRRAIREKGEEVIEHKDALADEIFEEITTARAPRATRVASDVPHDADGVVLEDEEINAKGPADKAFEAVTSAEEIIEDTAETPNDAAHTSHVGAARQAEEEVRASSAANSEPQPTAAQTGGPSAPPSVAGPEAVESPAINSEAGIPVSAPEPPAGAPGRIGVMPPNHDPDPVQLDRTKPAPWCADPEDCGGASWTHTCGSCLRLRAQTDAARALQ